jgi:hypothetical protein
MRERKLPGWVDAIGRQLAKSFDVSNEPLPGDMEIMLRLIDKWERRHQEAESEAAVPPQPAGTGDGTADDTR